MVITIFHRSKKVVLIRSYTYSKQDVMLINIGQKGGQDLVFFNRFNLVCLLHFYSHT